MLRRTVSSLALGLALAGLAGAAGFSIYEHDAAATAQGGAFVARSVNPSSIVYNPAGIVGQERAVSLGTTLITPSGSVRGDNPFPGIGYEAEQEPALYYPSHLYFVMPVADITFGLGVFNPFGLGTEWDETYAGRSGSVKTEIQTFYVNPVVGYQVENLKLAMGLQAVYATVAVERIAQTPILTSWENVADVKLEGDSEIAWGFNFGAQYTLFDMITIGANYRSQVDTEYDGEATLTAINNPLYGKALFQSAFSTTADQIETDIATQISMPAIMGVGLAIQPTEKLTVAADVLQMNWSCFDVLAIQFTDDAYSRLNESIPEHYEDSRSYRVGAEYMVTPVLALRAGYLYDESPAPSAAVSTLLPDANRNSWQGGIGYTMGNVQLDFAYMYLPFNDRSSEQENHRGFDGLFETTAHLFGITVGYRF